MFAPKPQSKRRTSELGKLIKDEPVEAKPAEESKPADQ
jgi:hypothetical protein